MLIRMNINKDNIKIGQIYSYTNESGYTSRILVARITDKSIFFKWANMPDMKLTLRMSYKSFSIYKPEI